LSDVDLSRWVIDLTSPLVRAGAAAGAGPAHGGERRGCPCGTPEPGPHPRRDM